VVDLPRSDGEREGEARVSLHFLPMIVLQSTDESDQGDETV